MNGMLSQGMKISNTNICLPGFGGVYCTLAVTAKKPPASCENEMLVDIETMHPDTSSSPNCSLES